MHKISTFIIWFNVAIAIVNCYKATVVEYIPGNDDSPEVTIESNLREYVLYIQQARLAFSDIIVFPEYGLTNILSDEQFEKYALQITTNFNNEMEEGYLKTLSNEAKANRIYVVVNFIEKEERAGNITLYNTNVVFNRDGDIVAKYRKINLYNEDGLTPGNQGNVTFKTDFGVTFGIFTSYDILFYNPSRLVLEYNVTDIIYPTAWFSYLPLYISSAMQHGYVKSAGVNLLAASLNLPTRGATGSGIYEANGDIKKIEINGASKSIDKTAAVTKHAKQLDSCDVNYEYNNDFNVFSLKPDENDPNELNKLEIQMHSESKKYQYTDLDLSKKNVKKDVCYGSFCCTFNITVRNYVKEEYFRLAIYRDTAKNKDINLCLLVHCANEAMESCGSRSNSNTTFSRIEVSGKFDNNKHTFIQPYTLDYDYKPLENVNYCNNPSKDRADVKLVIDATGHLVAIGLFGTSSGTMVAFNMVFIFAVIYNAFRNLN